MDVERKGRERSWNGTERRSKGRKINGFGREKWSLPFPPSSVRGKGRLRPPAKMLQIQHFTKLLR